ncbi:MAG: MATE family efflux transporter [Spirochaetes bacterium]|nr:MATE family efflux transporter [Spirochaetota bacterium]
MKDRPYRDIMTIALPIIAGSFLETLYNLTDAFFLGKLGAAEISAPSIAFTIVFFLIVFGMGMSGAGTTLIAQSKGRNDGEKMNFYLGQMTSLLIAASIAIAALGFFSSGWILRLLATPEEVFRHAYDYLRIIFLGIPFMFGYFVLQSSFSAVGDSMTPFWIHLGAIVVNVALDPLLIFGIGPFPRLGVPGAAIATVASQAAGSVFSYSVLARGKNGLKLRLSAMKPDRDALGLFIRIGLPSSVGESLSALGFTVLQGVINGFGTSAIAAFGIGSRIMGLFDMPARGISSATAALSGQAIGARDEARVGRVVSAGLILCVVLMTPPLVLSMIFGGNLVRFFVNDPGAIELGDLMFKVVAPSLLTFGLYVVTTGAFQGAGDTRIIMFLAVFRLWVIRVPIATALAAFTKIGPLGIWIAMFASNLLTATAGILYFRSGKWKGALDAESI